MFYQVVVVQKPVFIKPKLPVIAASPNPIPRASIMWATPASKSQTWPRGYKTFFKLSSVEHEISTAHKC